MSLSKLRGTVTAVQLQLQKDKISIRQGEPVHFTCWQQINKYTAKWYQPMKSLFFALVIIPLFDWSTPDSKTAGWVTGGWGVCDQMEGNL